LLDISAVGHLEEGERQRAKKGFTKTTFTFLLNALNEEKYDAVYLYQQKEKLICLSLIKMQARQPALTQVTF
jgi:hypothetical protein|tara:strand:+ start:218 stop:433 length:216 start_codon:yes stop_codon:yes gene_type:complete